MKRVLEDSLARECPVSVFDVAAQNGYANAGCTRLEFPGLCQTIGQKIAQRKKTEMNRKGEILKAALEEDPPLTAEQMARRLGLGVLEFCGETFLRNTRRFLRKEQPTRRPKESSYVLT